MKTVKKQNYNQTAPCGAHDLQRLRRPRLPTACVDVLVACEQDVALRSAVAGPVKYNDCINILY